MTTEANATGGVGQVGVTVVQTKPSDAATPEVLRRAGVSDLKGVLVLGYDAAGNEYIDCNIDDGGEALWLLQRAIHLLVSKNAPK